jgi:hypothetical protein
MADLIIKPSVGNLILKDDQNVTRVSIAPTTGVTTLSNQVFPAGHVIQMNYTRNVAMDISRSGDKSDPATTGITCVLPNDLISTSKLFAQFTTQIGEEEGTHYALQTFITLFNNSVNLAPATTDANTTNQGAGLGSASWADDVTQAKYQSANVAGQILFTPTGSGAARRTVEMYWGSSGTTSYTSWLNRAHNSATNYKTGGTTITLMEVAG